MKRCSMYFVVAGYAAMIVTPAYARNCENILVEHLTAQAVLAAYLVSVAEGAGMQASEINRILNDVADQSAIDEFWITDSSGHAYLTNTGVDFKFSSDPDQQPQASAFWPLLEGRQKVVVQEAQRRELDDRVFKYVGVAGVDKPRIVQVGVDAENFAHCD